MVWKKLSLPFMDFKNIVQHLLQQTFTTDDVFFKPIRLLGIIVMHIHLVLSKQINALNL